MDQNQLEEVFFSKKCVERMEEHVGGDCERERAGFLVGKILSIDGKLCTYASEAVPAEGASGMDGKKVRRIENAFVLNAGFDLRD